MSTEGDIENVREKKYRRLKYCSFMEDTSEKNREPCSVKAANVNLEPKEIKKGFQRCNNGYIAHEKIYFQPVYFSESCFPITPGRDHVSRQRYSSNIQFTVSHSAVEFRLFF